MYIYNVNNECIRFTDLIINQLISYKLLSILTVKFFYKGIISVIKAMKEIDEENSNKIVYQVGIIGLCYRYFCTDRLLIFE